MTVKELIEKLQTYSADYTVKIDDGQQECNVSPKIYLNEELEEIIINLL